jgi:hypothetical protein
VNRAGPDPVAAAAACAETVREALLATVLSEPGSWGGGSGRPRNAPALAAVDARRVWREGLGQLARALPHALAGDGVPVRRSVTALASLAGRLEDVRLHARELGVPVPAAVEAARVAALDVLDALEGGVGALPPLGGDAGAALPDPVADALARTRADWARAPALPAFPPAARTGRARAVITDAWSLRAFLGGGLVVGTHPFQGATGRLVAWAGGGDGAAGLALGWDLGGRGLLASGEEPELAATGAATVTGARADGRRARIDATWPAGVRRWRRTVRTHQARLRIDDVSEGASGTVRRAWRLGRGWELRPEEDAWVARNAELSLRILLPSGWGWRAVDTPDGPALVGEASVSPGACVSASVELRRASGGGVAEGAAPLRPQ